MGMSPGEVNRTSFWQFMAAWNGYVAANSPDSGKLTEREAEALFDWIDNGPIGAVAPELPQFTWDGSRIEVRQ